MNQFTAANSIMFSMTRCGGCKSDGATKQRITTGCKTFSNN